MSGTEIRKMKQSDAEELLSFFKKLVVQDPERVERKQDVDVLSVQDERDWIQSRNKREKEGEMFTLIATRDGEVVAEGEIERKPRWIEKHVAEIRFGMLPGNQEITIRMLERLIQQASERKIEVLLYFHLATQKDGISIIRELGFEKFGTVEGYYKRDGEYTDRVYYSKNL